MSAAVRPLGCIASAGTTSIPSMLASSSGVGARAPIIDEEAPIGRSAKRFMPAVQVMPGVLLISSI